MAAQLLKVLIALVIALICVSGFGVQPQKPSSHLKSDLSSSLLQRESASSAAPLSPFDSLYGNVPTRQTAAPPLVAVDDLKSVEFVSASDCNKPGDEEVLENSLYPLADMLRGSARYIADHRQETAVFYIPGDILAQKELANNLLGDIALSWMLGLKIVIVVGCRFDVDCCSLDFNNAAECHNSLRVTDDELLRKVSEEAGYVRFEVERILNRHLRLHAGVSTNAGDDAEDAPALNGNVVGGNFYVARSFGSIDGVDYKNTGYPTKVHSERIQQALDGNDVVLLSTVGTSRLGDLVNVNGNHLAATVAASLQSRKLVILSNSDGAMLRKGATKTMQEVPLSFTKALLNYYDVKVNKVGFASFAQASKALSPRAVELLLHLGWSSWAMDQGVNRAHIVNPGDGSLLEELFTSKLGVNTCVYHEDETENLDIEEDADFFRMMTSP